jgi:hypothetical protein
LYALQVLEEGAGLVRTLEDWLDGEEQQVVFVRGSWLLELPPAQQQEVVDAFSRLGYWQIGELEEGLLLASRQGLDRMERELQLKEAKLFEGAGWDSGAGLVLDEIHQQGDGKDGHGSGAQQPSQQEQHQGQGGQQQQQQQGQGGQEKQGGQQQQQEGSPGGGGSSGGNVSPPATASSSAAGADGKCRYHKLESHHWEGNNLLVGDAQWEPVILPGPVASSSTPRLQVTPTSSWPHGQIRVEMTLTACSKTDEVRQA